MLASAQDNLIFYDENGLHPIIFHRKTWLFILKGILTHYLNHSEHQAESMICHSSICSINGLDYYSAMMIGHETVYHWAMILAYGEQYWHLGYCPDLPDDYEIWLKEYSHQHQLKQTIIE